MQVENVTWVSLTTRRTTQKKRHLTVGNSLLRQVIVDDKGVLAIVTEPLTNRAARERSQILQRSSIRGGGTNNDRVLEGIVLLQRLDKLGNSRTLLTNSDVNAVQFLLVIVAVIPAALVQDGVKSDSRLTGLTVTNDQLTLTTANGHHGIDRLHTSLHRLVDTTAGQDTRRLNLGTTTLRSLNGALTVNRVTEGVDDTTKQLRTDRHIDNLASALDNVTLLDQGIGTEHGNTNIVRLEVKSHTTNTGGELNHLFGHDVTETVDTGNTVTNGEHAASLLDIKVRGGTRDALLENRADLRGSSLGRSIATGSSSEGRNSTASLYAIAQKKQGIHVSIEIH